MYLNRIAEVYFGYVRFKAEGYYIERFINHCRSNGFYLGELNRVNSTMVEASVTISDYKEICKIAKKNKCKIKILKKKGIPFIINKYRKRKVFVIALFLLCISIFFSSKFIWNIEITGNNRISDTEIMNILNEEGLTIGKYKKSINEKTIIDRIRSCKEDIAWVRN